MEGYFERVVDTLTAAGYRWYETANFCRARPRRDLRAHHNLGYWRGRDYLGLGVGAVSTVAAALAEHAVPAALHRCARTRRAAGRELEPLAPRGPARRSACCSAFGSTSRCAPPASTAPSTPRPRTPRAPRPRPRAHGGARARAHRPRPLPRRRRHRRAPRPASPRITCNGRASRAQARDPAPGRRGVRRDRPAGGVEGARRAIGPGRLGVDRPQRAGGARGARAADAPAHLRGPRADGRGYRCYADELLERHRAAAAEVPARPTEMRSEIEGALQSTTEMLSQVTRLLALVSAPPLETGHRPPRRGARAAAAKWSWW